MNVLVDFENLAKKLPAGTFLEPSGEAAIVITFVDRNREARVLGILVDAKCL